MDFFSLIIGFGFIVFGIYMFITDAQRAKYGFHTVGKVVKVEGKWDHFGGSISYLYYPLVKFIDEDQQEVELPLAFGTFPPIYSKGQTIDIVYYNFKVYPVSPGWKVLYGFLCIVGIAVILISFFVKI